ncbi:peptide/nickel transport system permease protein [Albimonas donghaensis]|uniref:Peptide/nickel transport system permease protein n=1 Tax=Albimonas donghaensis TaxID=356660 RepID=A0A1H3AT06_9RHOB|nr:ABC transporter permease [Albimonas donghaensis]SDX32773.1 peptide/nickel transport system permease protein [Albimonas donghaensis]
MIGFLVKRLGLMALTALVLTFVVFALTNLEPNLEKLAKEQNFSRMSDEQVASWLEKEGYNRPLVNRYAEWVIQAGSGDLGQSTRFREPVASILGPRLWLTAKLMFWVMIVMVPCALALGVLAGMREGSRTDRTLSTVAIASTATPEYVSGVILVTIFASSAVGLKWLKGSATSAAENITFENFALPVATMALYGMGYIARMTRASMAEVMTAQYIRTARLKGVSFPRIVVGHALRNALIAPFTVIMLQFPWLLTGVVIVETLFNYKGFGWLLVEAASNNDIELLLSCSVVAVVVVLATQLISDIGYVFLNPRIRVR